MKFKGIITDVVVREHDILINYVEYPDTLRLQVRIGEDELLGYPFIGNSIQVITSTTNRVLSVVVNDKTILNRIS